MIAFLIFFYEVGCGFNVTFSDILAIVTGKMSSFQILTNCRAPNAMGS